MKTAKNLRYKRTLFIGLGGAGARTLRILKQQIKEANSGKLPKQVRFLLIDTNATELSNYRDFDCSEKVCIAVREPYQRYLHDKGLKTHEFIPEQNSHSLLALERGAGQIRSNGHFAVIESQYSNKLARILRQTAEELENIDVKGETLERDPKIEVRMVFSIAGGTGSGTFLPISILVRAAIKHCEIAAYIYSATHYERVVEKSAKNSVMQNAYASLCELDYMMHFGIKDRYYEPISFNFGPEQNQQIVQSNRPFEEVYYLDKITDIPTPDTVEFAYNEIDRMQKNTADALFIAATNIISSHTGTIDNVRQKIMEGQFDVNDKFAWISGLGMAELYLNQESMDSQKVLSASNLALKARTNDCDIDDDAKNRIVSSFLAGKWDESGGEGDGDPILKNFLDIMSIQETCVDYMRASHEDSKPYDTYGINLDTILSKQARNSSASIIAELSNNYEGNLKELLVSLLDNDEFGGKKIEGAEGKNYGISLKSVIAILEAIHTKIEESCKEIEWEKKEHDKKESNAKDKIEKFRYENEIDETENTLDDKSPWYKRINPFSKKEESENVKKRQTSSDYSDRLAEKKGEALCYHILKQRDDCTIKVLKECDKKTNELIKKITDWHSILKSAYDYGSMRKSATESIDSDTEKKENKVEVQLIDVDKYRLDFMEIINISKKFEDGRLDSGQSIFDEVCKTLANLSGSLQAYLSKGLEDLSNKDNDINSRYNKDERTPLQKTIDRLIDLSTPTMQIDCHGFGDRVKADYFWYVMTDCGEDTWADSAEARQNLKKESVGGLLKRVIEQNTLDTHVNLVHVSGWKNKAILYRVVAAVPPYFVEGVCANDCGGITLESCYEELKKTKLTYTPFSHEVLRKKLENGRTVLKPHEETSEDIALGHWVNYMILHYIDVMHEKDDKGEDKKNIRGIKNLHGIYTIKSEELGEFFTGEVVRPTKILILGNGSRAESFNMFARYCKTLIEENKEYQELIDPLEIDEYEEKLIVSSESYMNDVLVNYYGFSAENIAKLPEHDPDKELIRRELSLLDKRMQKHEEEKTRQKQKQEIFNSHISSKDAGNK